MFPRRRRTSAFEMHPDSCNGSSSALASFGLVEMKLNARRRPLLCVCTLSVQSAFASFLACLCKRSGADPRGLWDAANKRQTIPEDTPRPRPSMMAPILAHIGSPPFWATTVASFFLQESLSAPGDSHDADTEYLKHHLLRYGDNNCKGQGRELGRDHRSKSSRRLWT